MKKRICLMNGPAQRSFQPAASQRGATLIAVIIVGFALLFGAASLVSFARSQTLDRMRYEVYKDEFAASEIAINKAIGHMYFALGQQTPNFEADLKALKAPRVDGMTFPTFRIERSDSSTGPEMQTTGQYAGYLINKQTWTIDVVAQRRDTVSEETSLVKHHTGTYITQNVDVSFIPLCIHAIFYDLLMEIAPSPKMDVIGLVHSNKDAYFQSANGLFFHKNVDIHGNVHYGRAPGYGTPDVVSGDVGFLDAATIDTLNSMKNNGTWLESNNPDWNTLARDLWNSGLRDEALGAPALGLPLPQKVTDARTLIERAVPGEDVGIANQRLENKAGLKILYDGTGVAPLAGTDSSGNPVPLTYPDPADPAKVKSIVTVKTFSDARENKVVSTLDINVANMVESGIYPSNGIVYATSATTASGAPGVVRLTNGAQLPKSPFATGFTVATDAPLYIKGDYNTTQKTLAMVAGDSLMVLSNAWNDVNGARDGASYTARVASNTTVNTVAMHGIVETLDNNRYSGGVENNFRFLENWGGKVFTFNGTIAVMWKSKVFLGKWGEGNVYSPPQRVWSWDAALGGIDGPPGSPSFIQVSREAWQLKAKS